ncbi:MFS transporter [Vibrio gazogenes]|uniref:Predicted arabinose efflux permease, MFS family n=1 Tax=Vibrio gazogenes DSM 21264 = NBRC 103151 TaxID=1123492 RepID=A0A1M4YV84_VIBGA|nr:MFS transporter [Vibrio gazogenes]USP15104.1 MFS transporter [Vibrio gazogenes]SHF09477.1 Predicted arabinose efflux permease, MFS family [Vibrio gazogenes DSM 21264] [Vibrio gazogenes DSM 21264 = NBRC 103151]SJN56394.1 Multidrug resistance protein MdtH [Vibrio gazogenes]
MKKYLNIINKEIFIILLTTLLSNVGIFMVIPFLAIYLTSIDTITTVEVGTIIGIAFWFQRAGSLLGGVISDTFSSKSTMLIGLLVRIPGYLMLGYVVDFYLLTLSCSLIGLGSSIYLPAAKSSLVSKVDELDKVNALSLRMICSNVGVAVGPVIGLFIFESSPEILFNTVGAIFTILFFFNCYIEPTKIKKSDSKLTFKDFHSLCKRREMISISIIMCIFMIAYMQLEVTIPLFAKEALDNSAASLVFIVNAISVVLLQLPISKWACHEDRGKVLCIGGITFLISFIVISEVETSLTLLLFAVVLFTLGEIIFSIRLDYDATNIDKNLVASSFGILSLAGAFGGLIGSYIGGSYYNFHFDIANLDFWKMSAILSALISIFFYVSSKYQKRLTYA